MLKIVKHLYLLVALLCLSSCKPASPLMSNEDMALLDQLGLADAIDINQTALIYDLNRTPTIFKPDEVIEAQVEIENQKYDIKLEKGNFKKFYILDDESQLWIEVEETVEDWSQADIILEVQPDGKNFILLTGYLNWGMLDGKDLVRVVFYGSYIDENGKELSKIVAFRDLELE